MAKNLKLVEITSKPWVDRWKPLTEILKSHDVQLTLETITASSENLKEHISKVSQGDADICRVSDDLAVEVPQILARSTFESGFVGAASLLVRDKGFLWPRSLLDEAFSRTLSKKIGQVDLNSFALVAGVGAGGRQIISALAKMGYSTVNITDVDAEKSAILVNEIKKKIFQVRFNAVPFQQLTTLPGVHSIMVNTTPLTLENHLLDELYFFNFLKAGGIVIDTTLVPAKTPLIFEAEQWGARHLSGDYIEAAQDHLMIEKILGLSFDEEAYRVQLRTLVDTMPFDSAPYLNRFRERGS